MRGQDIRYGSALPDAAACGYFDSKNLFRAVVVLSRIVKENAFFVWLAYRPAGKAASDLLDILLRVSAVNTERVKLHQLAGVILVNAAGLACRLVFCCGVFTKNARIPIVEIKEHGGPFCRRT